MIKVALRKHARKEIQVSWKIWNGFKLISWSRIFLIGWDFSCLCVCDLFVNKRSQSQVGLEQFWESWDEVQWEKGRAWRGI